VQAQTIPNRALPEGKNPTSETEYVFSERLTCTEGRSNKHYIVRVYRYPDGTYSVVAFNGRIGGSLTKQPKGMFSNEASARRAAEQLIRTKERGRSRYISAPDNMQAPGRPAGAQPAPEPEPPRTRQRSRTPQRRRTPAPAKPKKEEKPKEPEIDIDKIMEKMREGDETGWEEEDGGIFV
jgi:hypothetical protein